MTGTLTGPYGLSDGEKLATLTLDLGIQSYVFPKNTLNESHKFKYFNYNLSKLTFQTVEVEFHNVWN